MMKTYEIAHCIVSLFLLLTPCAMLPAQKTECGDVAAMARMARAISPAELAANRQKAGESYRARVIYAARLTELYPDGHDEAVLLLKLIPKDAEQNLVLMTLGDHQCGTESYREMKVLDQLQERLPRDLARAVLLAPDKMPEYVAYSIPSVEDPHSDYAMQMQKVCRVRHTEFIDAVAKLPAEKKEQFLKYIFDPEECDALTLPEGE
jgi:hypothetical protein